MTSDDIDYYRECAERERTAALQAAEPYIAEIHLELARSYDALAEHPELRPELRVNGL